MFLKKHEKQQEHSLNRRKRNKKISEKLRTKRQSLEKLEKNDFMERKKK